MWRYTRVSESSASRKIPESTLPLCEATSIVRCPCRVMTRICLIEKHPSQCFLYTTDRDPVISLSCGEPSTTRPRFSPFDQVPAGGPIRSLPRMEMINRQKPGPQPEFLLIAEDPDLRVGQQSRLPLSGVPHVSFDQGV